MSLIANNNRKPAWKLVFKSLKTNRFRTFCILFTICTCTFVMTFLPCVNTLDYLTAYEDFAGEEHAVYTSLTQEEISALSQDSHFEKVFLEKYGDLGQLEGEYARPVYQKSPEGSFPGCELIEGSLPKGADDILLDSTLAKKLHAALGKVYTFQSSGRSLRLQVCGIAKAASGTSIPNFYVSGLFAETSPLFTGKDFSLKVWLKQEFLSGGLEKSSALLARIGEEYGISDSQTSPNYYSIDTNPLTPSVILVYFFLDLLVMVIGLLVIYSIFYISIMSRIQAFGQMQTLGMTAGQIRRMVNLESSMLCLLGSTTGILPGLLLAGAVTGQWSLPYMAGIGLIVFFCSYIFLMAFLQKPAKVASRITPWKALIWQENSDFSFSGRISCRSLGKMRAKKNRKKMFFTRLSMVTGGIFFLLTAAYISFWNIDLRVRSGYFQEADYILSFNSEYLNSSDTELIEYQEQNIFSQEFLEKLGTFSDVEKVFPLHEEFVNVLTDQGSESTNLIAFDEKIFSLMKPYLSDSSLTYDELEEKESVLYNPIYYYGTDYFQKGSISLNYYNGSGYENISLPVAGTIDPKFSEDYVPLNTSFLVPVSVFEKMYPDVNTVSMVYITTKNHIASPELEQYLKEFSRDCPLILMDSYEDYHQELARQNRLLLLLFAGATLIVIIFSVLNLLNSTLNKMVTQNRELALFEAVGMTRKEIKKMLLYECLYMCRMPLVISWVLGVGINFLLYRFLFLSSPSVLPYHLPLVPLLLWSLFVLAVPMGITLVCYRHFTKAGLMERLKRDE